MKCDFSCRKAQRNVWNWILMRIRKTKEPDPHEDQKNQGTGSSWGSEKTRNHIRNTEINGVKILRL